MWENASDTESGNASSPQQVKLTALTGPERQDQSAAEGCGPVDDSSSPRKRLVSVQADLALR